MVFAVTSMIDSRVVNGITEPFALRNLLIYAMIILTLVSMFGIASRMAVLREQMGVIDEVPQDDARAWSSTACTSGRRGLKARC